MSQVGLVLGTMTIGESVFNPLAEEFIDAFLDAGHLELDTAYSYNNGDSERLLGEIIPNLERDFRISTKVNPRNTGKLDAETAYTQVEESLKRLNISRADTIYLHFPDPCTPVISVLEAMNDLHEQGRFNELGISNFPAWMVSEVWHICDRYDWIKPTVYQGVYNPLSRNAEHELNSCLDHFGMRFYAYNPLCGGLLTGRYDGFESAPADGRFTHRPNYQGRYWKESLFEAASLIGKAAKEHGITSIEATYRWLAFHSMLNGERGDSILIGASKLDHLSQNMRTIEAGTLPDELVETFDEAWQVAKCDAPRYFVLQELKDPHGGERL